MFDTPERMLLGLLTGVAFGFVLHKARVADYAVILGQFLLRDWTVAKVMATAVAVGAVGVHTLVALGLADLHIKPFPVGGVLAGGVLFGVGLAVLGYCPGTTVAAAGSGRRDALVGVLGLFAGAALYVALYPQLRPVIHAGGDLGKLTLPGVLGVSPALVVALLVAGVAGALWLSENRRRDWRLSRPLGWLRRGRPAGW